MLARAAAAVEDRLEIAVSQMCPEGRAAGLKERKEKMR
jgi:hypothetical protein